MADEPKPEERARAKQGMNLAINGLVVGVERKAIKNLYLSVYPPDGRVHVSAPLECPDERIRMYVLEKWVWITEKRHAIGKYSRQEAREYVSGEAHYFRGDLYRLKVEECNNSRQGVRIDGDYLVLTAREKSSAAHRAAVMAAWHKDFAGLKRAGKQKVHAGLREMGFNW